MTTTTDINSAGFRSWFDAEQRKPIDAVPTTLPLLNSLCNGDGGRQGLARGWFVTVGGNPGYGKSLLAMNFAATAMRLAGEPVGYVSLEMTSREIAQRVYAIATDQPVKDFERDGYNASSVEATKGLPRFWVPRKVAQNWENVIETFEEMHAEGCRYFVLDYLQLVQAGTEKTVFEAISQVVTYLRGWALNNGCVLVALSQYNRETSKNYWDSPSSQSLWGGMMLEASSDIVLLLDHSRYERDGPMARTWLLVDKNRHGARADIPIEWNHRTLTCSQGPGHASDYWPKHRKRPA